MVQTAKRRLEFLRDRFEPVTLDDVADQGRPPKYSAKQLIYVNHVYQLSRADKAFHK